MPLHDQCQKCSRAAPHHWWWCPKRQSIPPHPVEAPHRPPATVPAGV